MKTFAESQGHSPFDWNLALKQAIANPLSAEDHYYELRRRATAWVTCACGNQCATLSRWPIGRLIEHRTDDHGQIHDPGAPKDLMLEALGVSFFKCIEFEQYEKALGVLQEIEARSTFLLVGMEANPV